MTHFKCLGRVLTQDTTTSEKETNTRIQNGNKYVTWKHSKLEISIKKSGNTDVYQHVDTSSRRYIYTSLQRHGYASYKSGGIENSKEKSLVTYDLCI